VFRRSLVTIASSCMLQQRAGRQRIGKQFWKKAEGRMKDG
jgi:hypothetical protein